MRLIQSLFGGGPGCARFEKAILLSISGDLAGRSARVLERHLARCAGCRESLARSAKLREQCLEVAAERRYVFPSRWPAIASGLDEAPAPVPASTLEPLAWEHAGRRRFLVRMALSLGVAAAILCLLTPVLLDRLRGPESVNRTVLDTRWSKEWDEFVSGSESRGEINIDPFAPEIPNPEVIDF